MNAKRKSAPFPWIAWSAVALLGVLAALLWLGADRWWLMLPFTYGPRVVVSVLLLPVLVLLVRRPRHGILPALAGCVILFWGILGFRIGPRRLLPVPPGSLRIVSYNVAHLAAPATRLAGLLDSLGADIAVMVECVDQSKTEAVPTGWHLVTGGEFCLYSKYPVTRWNPYPTPIADASGLARADLTIDGRTVRLGLVHLGSPHAAAMMFADKSEIPHLGPVIRANQQERDEDARRARDYILDERDAAAPVIIAGDFNLTVESSIYRRWWSGFGNAFEQAGVGTGSSYRYRWYRVRIDHLLFSASVHASRAWIGPDLGSDHRPILADLKVEP